MGSSSSVLAGRTVIAIVLVIATPLLVVASLKVGVERSEERPEVLK